MRDCLLFRSRKGEPHVFPLLQSHPAPIQKTCCQTISQSLQLSVALLQTEADEEVTSSAGQCSNELIL